MNQANLRLLIYIVILGLVVSISRYAYLRFDLTEQNIYTLSEPTSRVLDRLEAPLHIKVYFSESMPIAFKPVVAYLRDLLAEYEHRGNGKVILEYIDPTGNDELTRQAFALGLQKVKANVTEKGRMELAEVWFGFALVYRDQKEVFPSVGDVNNFESDVTSAIVRLIQPKRPILRFVGPSLNPNAPETTYGHSFDKDMVPLAEALSEQFDLEHQDTAQNPDLVLSDADMIVLWGVHAFSDEQIYAIDQFLMSGRPALILVSGVAVDALRMNAHDIPPSRFDAFLKHHGLVVNRDLVADSTAQMIRRPANGQTVVVQYPLFPLITPEQGGFDPDFAPTQSMNSLMLPWVSSLDLLESASGDTRYRLVARSSSQAWLLERTYSINPEHVSGPHSFASYVLGIAFDGPATSCFAADGMPIPPGLDGSQHRDATDQVQFLVLGTDQVLGQFQSPSAIALVANVANEFVGERELSGIPRRESSFRPIDEVDDQTRNRLRWLSMTVGPFLVVLYATIRYWLRRRRKLTAYVDPA